MYYWSSTDFNNGCVDSHLLLSSVCAHRHTHAYFSCLQELYALVREKDIYLQNKIQQEHVDTHLVQPSKRYGKFPLLNCTLKSQRLLVSRARN